MRFSGFSIAVALLLTIAVGAARADQVQTESENLTRIAVAGYADGNLHLRLLDGSTRTVPLVEVRRLVIDTTAGLADLNEAEGYLEQDQPAKAISRYERALRVAEDFWPAIIRVRLLHACNRVGKFERAATYFLQVSADAPQAAARLMPGEIPKGRSQLTKRVVQRITAEADATTDAQQRVLLEFFRYNIWAQTGDRRTAGQVERVAQAVIDPSIGTAAVFGLKIGACYQLLDAGRHADVLATASDALSDCPMEVMPDLLLLKGRALLAGANGRQDLLDAGAAFMRVVIHFGDSAQAGDALLWAARVHERLDRTAKAVQLLEECLAKAPADGPLHRQAEAELERIRASG
ncbi:MAG: tetratricopeptide repeat protein [bacterium]|nr:tetratricopeptide repeat protein [bacterium]